MSDAQHDDNQAHAPRVSIIVPTYNRARFLARLLHALERQSVPADTFEVVVVDDGSSDGTATVLAQQYRYRLIALSQPNAGAAAARNAGILQASGDLLLFVDDDVVPEPALIERHIALHNASGVAVIGRLSAPREARQPAWARWELETLERQYNEMASGKYQPCARQFFTANASVAREALLRCGLFDPEFRRGEDVEVAYRLEEHGTRFVFNPDAVVLHDTPRTLPAWMNMAEQYGRYDVLMWHRGVRYMLEMTAEDLAYARKLPLRLLARFLVGRPLLIAALRQFGGLAIRAADRARAAMVARALCSLVFNVLYWDSFARAIGGRRRFWALMKNELRPAVPAVSAE